MHNFYSYQNLKQIFYEFESLLSPNLHLNHEEDNLTLMLKIGVGVFKAL